MKINPFDFLQPEGRNLYLGMMLPANRSNWSTTLWKNYSSTTCWGWL